MIAPAATMIRSACLILAALLIPAAMATATDVTFDAEATTVWQVADQAPIPPPAPDPWSEVPAYIDTYWLHPLDDLFAIRGASPALDVNALDHVPGSSWFLPGRTGFPPELSGSRSIAAPIVPVAAEALDRGGPLVVLAARLEGNLPHLLVRDAAGARFWLDFDDPLVPELRTAAVVVASRLLHAAGYFVCPSFIDVLRPEELTISPGAEEVGEHGGSDPLTAQRLERFFARYRPAQDSTRATLVPPASAGADTAIRVAASRTPEGLFLGGFAPRGRRSDDPNDLIPHEARRSLRGFAILAAWLDHWSIREDRTLDLYLQPQSYVRHYLMGLALTLGNGHVDPAGGRFESLHAFHPRLLDPRAWKPAWTYAPFTAMQWADALWGIRLLLSFTDTEIAAAVAGGAYSDPQVAQYVSGTLRERRDLIGRAWLETLNSSDRFTITGSPAGRWMLGCEDLGVSRGLRRPEDVVYLMTMRQPQTGRILGYQSRAGGQLQFDLTSFMPPEWSHRLDPSRYAIAEFLAWDHRGRLLTGCTQVHLYFDRSSGPRVIGIIRD
ncbi:MAG: hypothetical protein V1774_00085 [Candidatus Eisenbacteria bacterium]